MTISYAPPDLEQLRARLSVLQQSITEMEDLLARYQAVQEALHRSEQQFRLIVAGVKEYAIFMLDTRGYILSWNAGAQRIKGYSADEIIGQHFSIFYPASEIAAGKLERELAVATAEGQYSEEGWRVRKDGSLFWASVLITALYNEQGELEGFAKVTRDLTERKHAEEQREQLRERELQLLREREGRARAEALNELRQNFLTVVSHELRTPVTSLLGYAELLRRRIERGQLTPETMERPLGTIVEQVRRLDRLTAMLLDVTRLEGERIELSLAPLDMVALVERVARGLSVMAERHTLVAHVPDHPVLVLGDELRMEQVCYNLLHNAIKYSPEGSEIAVTVQAEAGQVRVAIADQGVGIPPDDVPHIFERFYRASNVSATNVNGMGVGLYLTRELVRRHGGAIDVHSVLGAGTTFTITLALYQP